MFGINPYAIGGAGLVLTAALVFGGVQSTRLKHAKGDLAEARAALINPETKQPWKADYSTTFQALQSCRQNFANSDAALAAQNAELRAKAEQDAAALARAEANLRRARQTNGYALALVDELKKPLKAGETCAAMLEIDARFLKGRL